MHGADQVAGDAFLARVLDDGEAFRRLDLTAAEVASSAAWVRAAAAQNERKRRAESSETTLQRMQQASYRIREVAEYRGTAFPRRSLCCSLQRPLHINTSCTGAITFHLPIYRLKHHVLTVGSKLCPTFMLQAAATPSGAGSSAGGTRIRELPPAESAKEDGNKAFAGGRYEEVRDLVGK